MISLDKLPPELYDAAIEWFIDEDDIAKMNKAVERYDPKVVMIEEGFEEPGYSVLVGDENGVIPSMWLDFFMNMGQVDSEWNVTYHFTRLREREEVIKDIYRSEKEVYSKADLFTFEYLYENGFMTFDDDEDRFKLVRKRVRPIRSKNVTKKKQVKKVVRR